MNGKDTNDKELTMQYLAQANINYIVGQALETLLRLEYQSDFHSLS